MSRAPATMTRSGSASRQVSSTSRRCSALRCGPRPVWAHTATPATGCAAIQRAYPRCACAIELGRRGTAPAPRGSVPTASRSASPLIGPALTRPPAMARIAGLDRLPVRGRRDRAGRAWRTPFSGIRSGWPVPNTKRAAPIVPSRVCRWSSGGPQIQQMSHQRRPASSGVEPKCTSSMKGRSAWVTSRRTLASAPDQRAHRGGGQLGAHGRWGAAGGRPRAAPRASAACPAAPQAAASARMDGPAGSMP